MTALEGLHVTGKYRDRSMLPTKGPMWGYPVPVLGAISPFLEPFRGRLSPNIDNVSEKLTLGYPHEGPWVDTSQGWFSGGGAYVALLAEED